MLEPQVTHKMMERLTKKQEPVLHEDLTNREREILMLNSPRLKAQSGNS